VSEVKWIHINVDMFDNRKIRYLRRLPAGNDIILIWVMLLTLAGKCNAGGMIMLTQNVPYTVPMLADEFGFEENTVKLAIEAFINLGMVSNDGFISITGWEEHQDADGLEKIRESNRIRKQKSREKQKLLQEKLQTVTESRDMSRDIEGQECDSSISISNSISNSEDNREDKDRGVGKEKEGKEEKPESLNDQSAIVIQEWNKTDLLTVVRVSPESERGKRLRARLKEYGLEAVLKAVRLASESDYLKDQHWFDFGWFVRPENFVKVLEGKYNRHGAGSNQSRRHGEADRFSEGKDSEFSDLRPSLDPDDESTWGT